MVDLQGRRELPGEADEMDRKPLDKSARLAIEAGPGRGFERAIAEMAGVNLEDIGNDMDTMNDPDSGFADAETSLAECVGVDDLAFAAKDMGIKRLVVVTPFADRASAATVLTLSRLLTEENHPVVLLQLDRAAEPLAAVNRPQNERGWIDLLGGGCAVEEIIHRDKASRLHVTASGGIDAEALEEDQIDDLSFYIRAFSNAYAMTVVHMPLPAVEGIASLKDGETAVIVAAPFEHSEEVRAIADELNGVSDYDVLHLVSDGDGHILH